MTLDEMARQLGVSKSTVSRALSGKGRIGEETRQRIRNFAGKQEKGQVITEVKAGGTHNLGVVFPADVYINGNPYFQECMLGICEAASLLDYNVLLAKGTAQDISEIQKLVEQEKVDGMILTRSLEDDRALRYLTERNFPVGLTGLCHFENVIQVDTDNEGASESLTSLLIGKGFRKFALMVEDLSYHVNRSRHDGFCRAIYNNGLSREKQAIFTGQINMDLMDTVIDNLVAKKVECIVCGDDVVCARIMSRMQAEGYRIPKDIAIASLYNSPTLDCFLPPVTAVDVPARLVGNVIGKQMIQFLQGKEFQPKTIIDYEILMRKSTNRE